MLNKDNTFCSRFCMMSCPPPDSGCPCTCQITADSTTGSTCSKLWPESLAMLETGTSTPPSSLTERARPERLMTITVMTSSLSSSIRRWSSALISSSHIRATRRCGATGESDQTKCLKPVTDLQVLLCWLIVVVQSVNIRLCFHKSQCEYSDFVCQKSVLGPQLVWPDVFMAYCYKMMDGLLLQSCSSQRESQAVC